MAETILSTLMPAAGTEARELLDRCEGWMSDTDLAKVKTMKIAFLINLKNAMVASTSSRRKRDASSKIISLCTSVTAIVQVLLPKFLIRFSTKTQMAGVRA